MDIKSTNIEGLYAVKDDGPVGPHHRKVAAIIDSVLDVAAYVELECGHTVVIFNTRRDTFDRLWFCGECAGLCPKSEDI